MTERVDPRTKQELKELMSELGPDTPLLLLSNLIVIVLALVQGWNILPLLWVYWWQNSIIGFFNWCRIKKLKHFSTEGFKIDGRLVDATEKTKTNTALYFLLHYGCFQLFYLIFIITLGQAIEYEVLLSATIGIAIFFFNHFYSYRYNLVKDLASNPNIGTLMFFPYLRVIPMHLIIFIGLWAGHGSRTELFFFLFMKTGVDMLMHVVQHVDWKGDGLLTKKKSTKLKTRIKLWFFIGWVVLLVLVLITFLVVAEINR